MLRCRHLLPSSSSQSAQENKPRRDRERERELSRSFCEQLSRRLAVSHCQLGKRTSVLVLVLRLLRPLIRAARSGGCSVVVGSFRRTVLSIRVLKQTTRPTEPRHLNRLARTSLIKSQPNTHNTRTRGRLWVCVRECLCGCLLRCSVCVCLGYPDVCSETEVKVKSEIQNK